MYLAERMASFGNETAFEYYARAAAMAATGRKVINFGIGEPDFATAPNVVAAAKRALDDGHTHYSPTEGLAELRLAIAEDSTIRRGVPVDPANVMVTPGAKVAMYLVFLALAQPGDEVIYPDPGFPMYRQAARHAGATPVALPLREENGFRLDPDELASLVTSRTRLIVLNSPANPTGGALTRSDLESIAAVAREHDVMVMTDEIYSRILYEGEHLSISALPGMQERTIVVDGFSKAYAMTGWRLGYLLLPPALTSAFARLVFNSVSNTATFSQMAAVEALRGPQDAVTEMVAEFRARRDLVVAGLNEIPGLDCLMPQGAFYVFPSVKATGLSGAEFTDRLLEIGGVSVLPGSAFGDAAEHHFRISYACNRATLEDGLERIRAVALQVMAGVAG
jgi:aspartate/methionine/tyrosine aminotransferase